MCIRDRFTEAPADRSPLALKSLRRVVGEEIGAGVFLAQRGAEHAVGFTQVECADAAVGGANEQTPQGRTDNRIVDLHPGAAPAVRCGSHPQV